MEKEVLEWSPELATYAWCLKGGDCLFVGALVSVGVRQL